MKKNLINETQPFGEVKNSPSMGSDVRQKELLNKSLGDKTNVENIGTTVIKSLSDRAPGALARAHLHGDFSNRASLFYYSGKPKKGI